MYPLPLCVLEVLHNYALYKSDVWQTTSPTCFISDDGRFYGSFVETQTTAFHTSVTYRQKLTVKIDSICGCTLGAWNCTNLIWKFVLLITTKYTVSSQKFAIPSNEQSVSDSWSSCWRYWPRRGPSSKHYLSRTLKVTQGHRNLQTGSYWTLLWHIAGQVSVQPTASYIDLDVLGV